MTTKYKLWVQLERIIDADMPCEAYEDDGLPDPIYVGNTRMEALRFIRKLPGWKPPMSDTSDYREFPRRPDIQKERRRIRETEANAPPPEGTDTDDGNDCMHCGGLDGAHFRNCQEA
jgi:hypothetical protein